MIVLGIETSCDDTCISVVENGNDLISFRCSSEHILKKYNGIIPEIASREHEKLIVKIFNKIKEKIDIKKIDLIAYTSEPGMVGCLHIGKVFAQTLSFLLNKPLVPINHITGHIFSPFINNAHKIKYPFLSLIASGGTTKIVKVNSPNDIGTLNSTNDDAIGEAFDKVGRLLGLKYPGGISIDEIFDESSVDKEMFFKTNPNDNFSFSGAKTKISNMINNLNQKNESIDVIKIASSFQYWAINVLIDKIIYYAKNNNINMITIGGGVTSNSYFRKRALNINLNVLEPNKKYTVDNATMIAFTAWLIYKK